MTIVLHHYSTSPFGELACVALGLKGLAWHSVTIPSVMPKPDLVELTGNYARTPVLQIGADLYCDTAAIVDALEAAAPAPSLYPAPLGALHRMIAAWAAGPQFIAHVAATLGELPEGALPQGFIDDRKARFGLDFGLLAKMTPHLTAQAVMAARWLDTALADGRAFIGGAEPGHGDLALYANLWFVRSFPLPVAPTVAKALDAYPRVTDWHGRVGAIGHGAPAEMTAEAAIAVARDAEPAPAAGEIEPGFTAGQAVTVRTENSGDPPVAGRLARLGPDGITVRRDSDRAGPVAVHFPRFGQIVKPA